MSYTQTQSKDSIIQERYTQQSQLRRNRRLDMLATKRLRSIDVIDMNQQNNQIKQNEINDLYQTIKVQLECIFNNLQILENHSKSAFFCKTHCNYRVILIEYRRIISTEAPK